MLQPKRSYKPNFLDDRREIRRYTYSPIFCENVEIVEEHARISTDPETAEEMQPGASNSLLP